jgi:hypothetical protein
VGSYYRLGETVRGRRSLGEVELILCRRCPHDYIDQGADYCRACSNVVSAREQRAKVKDAIIKASTDRTGYVWYKPTKQKPPILTCKHGITPLSHCPPCKRERRRAQKRDHMRRKKIAKREAYNY